MGIQDKRVKRLINQVSNKEVRTPIGTEIYIPNHSGVTNHPEALIENFKTNLTAGSVVFSNGTKLAEDNSNFIFVNATKFLGINLAGAAPDSPIHVSKLNSATSGSFRTLNATYLDSPSSASTSDGQAISGTYVTLGANNMPGGAGINALAGHLGTGTVTTIRGFNLLLVNTSSGTINDANGGLFLIQNSGIGTIGNANAGVFVVQNINASGVISSSSGMIVNTPSNSGTLTSHHGIRISDQTGGGTYTAVPFGIKQEGTGDRNYFAGNTGIGIATPQEKLSVEGIINVPKASTNGIKVDTTTPTFGFADIIGDQFAKNTGATKPALAAYNGAIDAWQFSPGDEAFMTFHIPHDYVKGTDIFLHVHWSQTSATATGGTLDFKYFGIYAKAHNQASGSTFTATPITATFSTININDGSSGLSQYQQFLTEIVISAATATAALFDRDDFEPDGVIELTFEMDANNLTNSVTVLDPFIHYVDLHYQTTGLIGTKDKVPDFYT